MEEDLGALAISVENLLPVSRRTEAAVAPERPPVFMWGRDVSSAFNDTSVDIVKNGDLRTPASKFVENARQRMPSPETRATRSGVEH